MPTLTADQVLLEALRETGVQDEKTVELSVVIPCYNEENGLTELHDRIDKACVEIDCTYELILVNDGSTDSSWSVMNTMADLDPHLVLVNLSRNFGQQLALSAGLSVARGRRVLVIDADLQDPPELLPEMMMVMDNGADVAYGRRRARPGQETIVSRNCVGLLSRTRKADRWFGAEGFRRVSPDQQTRSRHFFGDA